MSLDIRADYDSAWKEVITVYLEEIIALCFADVHSDIDWDRGYETLDTELQEVIREAETGRRLADKLIKVWLRSGENAIILIHIEVQGQHDADLPKRMHIYNNRLYDRYQQTVCSFVILGDDSLTWRPTKHTQGRWGCESSLKFRVVKLLDYQPEELAESNSVAAIMILAHLETMATRGDFEKRKDAKLKIMRRLYERGYKKNQILEIFRFLEWMMALPESLQQKFKVDLKQIEEEKRMTFITSFERDALIEGEREGSLRTKREDILKILDIRFGKIPSFLSQKINEITDFDRLTNLLELAVTLDSIDSFVTRLDQNILSE